TFRLMCNDAIRIALDRKPKNRFTLIAVAYQRLKSYGLHTHYLLSACEIANSVYSNKNRKSDPCIRKPFIKLDSQTYVLDNFKLRIPVKPRQFVYLTLQHSDYHLAFLTDPNLKRGSFTLTESSVNIAFSKETAHILPLGQIGIDVNEKNITWSDSEGNSERVDTSDIAEIKAKYRTVRARIARGTEKDERVRRRLLNKYGKREKNRTVQRFHRISKAMVEHANGNQQCIVMEKLKGIRKLFRKRNGQGSLYRGRMNSWAFREVQRQIEYKAAWHGIPVTYVNPRGTSRNCPCGSRVIELDDRQVWCPACDKTWDRDLLASKNIMARMVLRGRSSRGRSEREPEPEVETVIPRPDRRKLTIQ
ncbi:MAG TPA: transposase, partial [Candidatus Angelobacter sp.]|nr:transposase [Candidatus Angelobacter sp.]